MRDNRKDPAGRKKTSEARTVAVIALATSLVGVVLGLIALLPRQPG